MTYIFKTVFLVITPFVILNVDNVGVLTNIEGNFKDLKMSTILFTQYLNISE